MRQCLYQMPGDPQDTVLAQARSAGTPSRMHVYRYKLYIWLDVGMVVLIIVRHYTGRMSKRLAL